MESEKELTRDFSETVNERAALDPGVYAALVAELLREVMRLHSLVQASYVEGFREGLRLEHPAASADYSWNRSKSREDLGNE